jgi:hypothetical protein
MKNSKTMLLVGLVALLATSLRAETAVPAGWISLFNGKDLSGWTPKITGHPVGDNFANTFRVEDGILKVSYDGYGGQFKGRYGHLFSDIAYSHYIIRVEYLITGQVLPDAAYWCAFNSGLMIHAQSPQSMTLDQEWPVSMESQILGEGTKAGKQTANAVTIGMQITLADGSVNKKHASDSTSKLYPSDQWVTFEVEVHGNDLVIHRINGEEVMRYSHPVLLDNNKDAKRLLDAGAPRRVSFGHIALQAEGHPVWFRNIMIRPLDN